MRPSPAVVVPWVLMLALTASAQSDSEKLTLAREAYAAGQALYNQGQFARAVEKFEEANQLSPRAGNLYNIGRCAEQIPDAPRALRAYREYLRLTPEAKERAEVEAAIVREEAQLRARGVQQVVVRAEPEGRAQVSIDGRALGLAPVAVELTRGLHVLEVSAEEHATSRRELDVTLDHAQDVALALERLPAPSPAPTPAAVDEWKLPPVSQAGPPPPPLLEVPLGTATPAPARVAPRPYVWAWVTMGVAIAALGAGAVLGAAELRAQSDLKAGVGGPSATRDLAGSALALALGANIGYGVGGASGLASVFLFAFERK